MGPIAMAGATMLADTLLGLGLQKHNDKRQLKQQQKLMEMQIAGNKELAAYGQELGMKTWNATNYEAQRRHLENAGLNAALMYGSAGAGGSTASPSAGSVSGGNAPAGEPLRVNTGMGLQLGIQAARQKAEIENIQADTELKKTEAQKKGGPETQEIETKIENLKQMTTNAKAQEIILQWEAELKRIETNVEGRSQEEQIKAFKLANDKLAEEIRSARVKGNVDEATESNVITQVNNITQEQNLRIESAQVNIQKSEQEIQNLKAQEKKTTADTAFQLMANTMRENGVEASDHPALRQISKSLENSGMTREEVQNKIQQAVNYLKHAPKSEQPKIIQWLSDHRPTEWFK